MAMVTASSGLAYPARFYAAASYFGFDRVFPDSSTISRFQNDVALLLYGLYQQATAGPCTLPKPEAWNSVEQSKWTSWHGLGNMASTEAMRLFLKILEDEEPSWYSRVPELSVETTTSVDVEALETKLQPVTSLPSQIGDLPVNKMISAENGLPLKTQERDAMRTGLDSVGIYDQWVAPSVSGARPKPRYAHGAAVLHERMYIFGGNNNGHYLNDIQVLDLESLTWSRVEAKALEQSSDTSNTASFASCAGHSLVTWQNKILSIGGHTKDPSETIAVKEFDPKTCLWSNLKTYGKPPISRGGHSVTLVGHVLIIFGGEDGKRSLLNDLHMFDLETMTWDDVEPIGTPPSPRSYHAAACHANRYILIFGGGSHATCFNDLHVLDLEIMEWSKPKASGVVPGPRVGHAGTTVGENWFIAGGGDNNNGVSETLVLNMATLIWSVVTTVKGRVPLASESLSLVTSTHKGEDFLVSFGGYNGHYNNEVYLLKPSHIADVRSRMIDGPVSDSNAAILPRTDVSRDMELEFEENRKIKEIVMDNGDDSKQAKMTEEETIGQLLELLKAQEEELESTLDKELLQTFLLKEELAEAESKNEEVKNELLSVRGQLAAEQLRCFKLEGDVAELRQKLQAMETLEKEVELLRQQKAASEQEVKERRQSSGVWGWIAGTSQPGN